MTKLINYVCINSGGICIDEPIVKGIPQIALAIRISFRMLLYAIYGAFQYSTIYLLIHFMIWINGNDLAAGIQNFSLAHGIAPVTGAINAISAVVPFTNGNIGKLLAMIVYLSMIAALSVIFWKNGEKQFLILSAPMAAGTMLAAYILIFFF